MTGDTLQIAAAALISHGDVDAADLPQGYKGTGVGLLPQEWRVSALGPICSFENGDRSANYPSPGSFVPDGIPFINAGHLDGARVVLRKMDYITQAAFDRLGAGKVHPGDILFCLRGTLGKFAVVEPGLCKGAIASSLVIVRPRARDLLPEFLAWYFESDMCCRMIEKWAGGAAQPNLGAQDLARFLIALPPISEQRAIATVLSDVDRLVRALEALISKKREIKQAAMQQLLTGQTRLPGFSGEWETKQLGDFVNFLRHGTNSRAELSNDGHVRYLHYGDIHTSVAVRLDPHVTPMPRLSTERARTLDRLQDGDLVLVDASEDLDGVGKAVEITGVGRTEVVAGLHTIAARFDKAILADGFKAYLQFCPAFRDHLKRLAAGTKVYATSRAHVTSVEMPLPSIDEQSAVAAVLADMDAEIAALEARRDKARAIKKGMMQQLLTGRVRLVRPAPTASA